MFKQFQHAWKTGDYSEVKDLVEEIPHKLWLMFLSIYKGGPPLHFKGPWGSNSTDGITVINFHHEKDDKKSVKMQTIEDRDQEDSDSESYNIIGLKNPINFCYMNACL